MAWDLNKKELKKATPRIDRAKFVYNLSRASYEKEYDGHYQKPGAGARVLAFFFRILPKIGPLKAAKPKPPTPETAKWFEDSFDKTLDMYRRLLVASGRRATAAGQYRISIPDSPPRPAAYKLADDAYAKLALKLADRDGPGDPKMTDDIVAYFHDVELPFATKHDSKEWNKTLEAVAKLKSSTASAPAPRANPPTLR